jgi:hypothetical protein
VCRVLTQWYLGSITRPTGTPLSHEPAWAWGNRRPRPGPGRDAASAGTSCPKARVTPWPRVRVGAGPVLDGPAPRRRPGQCCHWHWQWQWQRRVLPAGPEMGRPLGTGTSKSAPFAEPVRRHLSHSRLGSESSGPLPVSRYQTAATSVDSARSNAAEEKGVAMFSEHSFEAPHAYSQCECGTYCDAERYIINRRCGRCGRPIAMIRVGCDQAGGVSMDAVPLLSKRHHRKAVGASRTAPLLQWERRRRTSNA